MLSGEAAAAIMFSLDTETLVKELERYKRARPCGRWNLTRYYMYSKLEGILAGRDGPDRTALSVSHSEQLLRVLGLGRCRITSANYPEYDLLSLPFADGSFDFCVSDQVLEHVAGDPFAAFGETIRVVRKGGFVAHTTVFSYKMHGFPGDYWRFTPAALRLMCGDRATVVECGGWGNLDVLALIELGLHSLIVPDDPESLLFSLATKNQADWPIVTWIVARVE